MRASDLIKSFIEQIRTHGDLHVVTPETAGAADVVGAKAVLMGTRKGFRTSWLPDDCATDYDGNKPVKVFAMDSPKDPDRDRSGVHFLDDPEGSRLDPVPAVYLRAAEVRAGDVLLIPATKDGQLAMMPVEIEGVKPIGEVFPGQMSPLRTAAASQQLKLKYQGCWVTVHPDMAVAVKVGR